MTDEEAKKTDFDSIRRHFDETDSKWYFSIVDVINVTTTSTNPRNYWKVQKNRLKKTDSELVTRCNQLKLKAKDGKYYLTDVGDSVTIEEILKILSPAYAESFEEWAENLETPEIKKSVKIVSHDAPAEFSLDYKKGTYPQVESDAEEFMLLVDAYRLHNLIVVKAFIAGVDAENIFVSVQDKSLIIKGRRLREERSEKNFAHQELAWGIFSRTLELPSEVEINKMEISADNGLLIIKLPTTMHVHQRAKIKMRTI